MGTSPGGDREINMRNATSANAGIQQREVATWTCQLKSGSQLSVAPIYDNKGGQQNGPAEPKEYRLQHWRPPEVLGQRNQDRARREAANTNAEPEPPRPPTALTAIGGDEACQVVAASDVQVAGRGRIRRGCED
jgi:hypothetical protein